MSEATTQDSQPQTRQPNVRFLVRGLPWFVRARELNAAAKEANIPARYDMGRSFRSGTRTSFVISKTEEQNEQAQAFLQKWLNENFARLDASAAERSSKADNKDGEKSESTQESTQPEEPAKTEESPQPEAKGAAGESSKTAPALTFSKLPPRPRRSNGSSAGSKGGSEEPSPAGKAEQASSSEQSSEKSSEQSGEAAKPAKSTKRKSKSARKPATMKVPRDDAVYIKVPGQTTMDEIRELLTGFSPVEIKLRHIRRRLFRRKNPEETQTNLAEAIVTVGADNQQKAIDTLASKELHGKPLTPVPSYRKMLLNAAQDDQQEPSPEEQTSVEHIE